MGSPSPFEVSRTIGNNLAGSFKKVQDENAIESILSEASKSGDPEVLHQTIGKILSQVSPERQGAAIKYIESAYDRVQEKQKLNRELEQKEKVRQGEMEAGVTPGLHPTVQAQQLKNKQPAKAEGGVTAQPVPPAVAQAIPKILDENKNAKADELAVAFDASGIPRIFSNSYIENRRREDESKVKRHTDISQKVLEKADTIAEQIPQKKSALGLMKDAIARKDLSFWSFDNLAELTGIEGLRSSEGALFKTAGKEYFLGNLGRAGARPNQWIEQQISDMLTKIGRSTEANLSVSRALENELDLDEERVRLTETISNDLENKLGYVPRDVGNRVNSQLKMYAERRQKELFNDLRAIKAIGEGKDETFMKVEEGTPVSKLVAKALLKKYKNDPKIASEEAKKLGYAF